MAKERTFLRGLTGESYGLAEYLRGQRSAPRVRKKGTGLVLDHGGAPGYGVLGPGATAEWLVGPGDDPFLSQSIQVHLVDLMPGGCNDGHAHQNEALYYVIDGRGHEIHDGERYDWEGGDAVVVHSDSVHQHFNDDPDRPARGIIFKAKTLWLLLGLWQQGKTSAFREPGYGPREDWSQLRTPGITAKRKVVKHASTSWEDTRDGRVRVITSGRQTDVRFASVDLSELEIAPGASTTKHWHMADEVLYVLDGRGRSRHWDVLAEIADRYYARVAEKPSTWEFAGGDVLYVPQNTVHVHENTGGVPLRMLSGQNRVFKTIGYDAVAYPRSSGGPDGVARPTRRRTGRTSDVRHR